MAIIGIDLGTTKSAAAILRNGRPEIIPNRSGGRTTPSVIGLSRRSELLVGKKPKHHRVTLADGPIEEVKRFMGTDQSIFFGGLKRYPQELSSYILKSIKEDAEDFLGDKITCSVITIPAYFNESARRATEEAGELAGLSVGMILDEPTSAALAYGLDRDIDQMVLVYDLGGGTFDLSVIEMSGGHFEVLAIDGNMRLGGKDFDRCIVDYVLQEIKERYKINLSNDPLAMHKIMLASEMAKCDLSYRKDTSIIAEAITDKIDVDVDISRELLEELIRPLVESTLIPLRRVLEKADLEPEDIDVVLLVGGSTRIPLVRETVRDFFNKDPRDELNPDECVALGAALYTALLDEKIKTTHGGGQLTPRTLSGELMELVVVPRTAYPLGIGVDEGGVNLSIILPSSSFYPVKVTRKDYFTAVDNQAGLEIWVYEGDNPIAPKNTPLGAVRLELPPDLPAGTPIWVTFSLNASRILDVTVQLPDYPELKVTTTINASGSMTPEHRKKISQGEMGLTTSFDSLKRQISVAEKLLEEKTDSISHERMVEIRWAIDVAKDAIEALDAELATQRVRQISHIMDELRLI